MDSNIRTALDPVADADAERTAHNDLVCCAETNDALKQQQQQQQQQQAISTSSPSNSSPSSATKHKHSRMQQTQTPGLSNRERRKEGRKLRKKQKKEEFASVLRQQQQPFPTASVEKRGGNYESTTQHNSGGKAARARAARLGLTVTSTHSSHRASGGAPVIDDGSADNTDNSILVALEALETKARLKYRPNMTQRTTIPMDNHGSMVEEVDDESEAAEPASGPSATSDSTGSATSCNLSSTNLRSFSLTSPTTTIPTMIPTTTILQLDLSRNELFTLPDNLTMLKNLSTLDLSRNWFKDLPSSLAQLQRLKSLRASHNMLRSTRSSLQLVALQSLPHLQELDIRFNQKCGKQSLADMLTAALPFLATLLMTISFPPAPGSFVGASAAERDPLLLRSQLEPWSTTALRRRLVADFGQKVLPPETYNRAQVMERLLAAYQEEANERTIVHVQGISVEHTTGSCEILDELLVALRAWAHNWSNTNQERTSINAQQYMILTSPAEYISCAGSKTAQQAYEKLTAHQRTWDLAQQAMHAVDPAFANKYTAVAVTHGFQGSPHIDRQNVGPFYGLALGDFEEGTGEIMVECSARVLARVNTKNRFAKVDGRFPHWVAPYDLQKDRYSLIYYQTAGAVQAVGPAVFQVPTILRTND